MANVIDIEQDGTLKLWGAELVTDIPIEKFDGSDVNKYDDDLMSQIVDTMSILEMQDLKVERLLVFYNELGAVVLAKPEAKSVPFRVKRTNSEYELVTHVESSRCKECKSVIQWMYSFDGHLPGCPFLLVQSVMTE